MRGILIRVGADGTDGGGNWVAPVDPVSLEFVYIPIVEDTTQFHPSCERRFDELAPPLTGFLSSRGVRGLHWQRGLSDKRGRAMHLDPDYEHLTYGDNGAARGRDLRDFKTNDIIVFYSGLRSIQPASDLVYALVGVFVVDEVVTSAVTIDARRRHENAHTRKATVHPADIVVRARPGVSGRCTRCIPIGEKRGLSNYYLRPDIEAAWGGLTKADGTARKSSWLNMSGSMPLLGDPAGFQRWWQAQGVPLVRSNFVA